MSRLAAIALLGWATSTSQAALLREALAATSGNELSVAASLSMWLFLVALGVALGGAVTGRFAHWALALGACALGPAAAGAIASARYLPLFLHLPAGELLTLEQQLLGLVLTLGPLCLIGGATFTLACRQPELAASSVYLAEALGWLLGGATATWVSVTWPPMLTASLVTLGCAVAVALLERALRIWAAVYAGAILLLVASGRLRDWETRTLAWRWPAQKIEASSYTRHGHGAILSRSGQSALYENGRLTLVLGERQSAEELAHLALLQVERPERVYAVGALGGLLGEVLKHPVGAVVVAERDQAVTALSLAAVDEPTRAALRDSRVRLVYGDPRRMLRGHDRWDAILLCPGEPSTAGANRLFTQEFFGLARRSLRPGGVLAFTLPGAEGYYGPELLARNGSIYLALTNVFPVARVTPLAMNYCLASDRELCLDGPELGRRLEGRHIAADFVSAHYFAALMPPERMAALVGRYREAAVQPNADLMPLAYLHHLLLTGRAEAGPLSRVLRQASRLRLGVAILASVIVLSLIAAPLCRPFSAGRLRRAATLSAVCAAGFAGMGLSVLLLVITQLALGALHHSLGAIVGMSMAGMAWAARRATRRAGSLRVPLAWGLLLCLALPFLARWSVDWPTGLIWLALGTASALSGAMVGRTFPLAVARGCGPAAVYMADLLSAALAGLGVGVLLLPVLGLDLACITLAVILGLAAIGVTWTDVRTPLPAQSSSES